MGAGPLYARLAGAFYVSIFFAALFGEVFVSGALVVDGNANETALRIAASPELWRFGFGAQALTLVLDVGVAWALYLLLRIVDREIALLAALFRIAYVCVYAPAVVANVVALHFAQMHATDGLATALRVHDVVFTLSLLFFGVHLTLIGILLWRKPVAVKWLGGLIVASGLCYIANTAASLLAPPLHGVLFPWVLLVPFVGELCLAFWLLFARSGLLAASASTSG